MTTTITSDLLTRVEAAEYLKIKPQTLAVWLCTKRYRLPAVMVGRRVMYRVRDLEKFLASRTVNADVDAE